MEKGRSPDPVLNALCRRSAGLQLGSGIRWRRRHLETTRNPTDRGSRMATRGELEPGQVVQRSAKQKAAAFVRARAGAARACGLSHADFAEAIHVPTPKCGGPLAVLAPPAGPSQTRSDAETAALLARLASLADPSPVPGSPPSAASDPPAPRLPRALRRRAGRRSALGHLRCPRFFLEIFSGTARLTGAFGDFGLS